MRNRDQISSLVWLAFALFIILESIRLPIGSWKDPGPGFIPLGSGMIVAVLSCITFIQTRRGPSKEFQESWYSKERWRNSVLVLATLFVYAFSMEILGFLMSTFLLLTFLFRIIEPQRWIVAVGGSATASFVSYALFELWLKVQLPKGILGF